MAKFKTKDGKEWQVEITVGHLKDLKADCGIDMRDALKADGGTVAEAVGDPDKFGQLIWLLCGEQAEKAGLTPEQFVHLFNGEVHRSSVAAIWQATFDFFQGPKAAEKAVSAFRAGTERADELMGEAWDKAKESLISNLSAGKLPVSSPSTPDPLLSAS